MTYIINPRIFYWISVLNGLKNLSIVGFITGLVGLAGVFVFYVSCCEYGFDDDEKKLLKRILRIAAPMLVCGLIGMIFIPDKQTLIEMLIAKTATVENAEWTLDALKQAVDYIVAAMK